MKPTERHTEELRDAFAASIESMGDGTTCPGPDALWESASETASPRHDEAVLLHVGECPGCAAAWRVGRNLASDSPAQAAGVGSRRGRFAWWWPVAASAAIAFVLIGLGVPDRRAERSSPVYRAREGEWLQSQVPGEDGLPRSRCWLRWTAGPEGTTYQVRVTDERLELLARGRGLEDAEFLVPQEALGDLPSGAKIIWQVTARLPDGAIVDSPGFISRIE